MYICERCKAHISEEKPKAGSPFPLFTVIGGIIGTIGTVLTGLVLIPVAIVAGVAGDALRHCGLCNREIEEDEPAYHMMESFDNDLYGQTFRPLSKPQPPNSNAQQQVYQTPPSQAAFQPSQTPSQNRQGLHVESQPRDDERSSQREFVFDRIEGKLVPLGLPESELDDSNIGLADLSKTDPTAEENIPLVSSPSDEPFPSEIDMPFDLANDFSINPKPSGPSNEPPYGEPLL
jgi:hypothetical protein